MGKVWQKKLNREIFIHLVHDDTPDEVCAKLGISLNNIAITTVPPLLQDFISYVDVGIRFLNKRVGSTKSATVVTKSLIYYTVRCLNNIFIFFFRMSCLRT